MRQPSINGALVACLVLGGCRAAGSDWQPCGHLTAAPLAECSGMVGSRLSPNVFWIHNDSGDVPRLFAIDRSGSLLAEVRVQGAEHVDWEDITADDAGNLYIGDFGNNGNERTDLVIYVVPEPRLAAGGSQAVDVTRRIPFYYPEQRAFPDRTDTNYDCEAMYWDAGALYLLTKHRSDRRTVLYRVSLQGEGRRAAERLGEFEFGNQVTAADLSPDGRRLAVLSYEYICVFDRPPAGDDFLSGNHHRLLIEGRQCEAICFDGARILFANEQREIYCLTLEDVLRRERFLPATPQLDVPRLRSRNATATVSGRSVVLVPSPDTNSAAALGSAVPRLRLAWSAAGLHVAAEWRDRPAATGDSEVVMLLMAGPRADQPHLGPGQVVWEVLESRTAVRVRRRLPAPRGAWLPEVHWRRDATRLELDAVLPLDAEPGAALAFNAIALDPRSGAEWSWSASSSTQPETNPMLWGSLRLRR